VSSYFKRSLPSSSASDILNVVKYVQVGTALHPEIFELNQTPQLKVVNNTEVSYTYMRGDNQAASKINAECKENIGQSYFPP
jgi:hypothetical protein